MSNKKRVLIIGAGHYGQVFLSYLSEVNCNVIGFIDDDIKKSGATVYGMPVLGTFKEFIDKKITIAYDAIYCAIGNNRIRSAYLSKLDSLKLNIPNFIHSSVDLPKDINLGSGVYILSGATIMPYVSIKNYAIISAGVTIAHHTVIGEGCLLSSGATIGAHTTIKEKVLIGIGATVISGKIIIEKNALIGAGTVIIRDVTENSVMVGNPGRLLRKLK